MTSLQKSEAEDYLVRMGVEEQSAWGVLWWIDDQKERDVYDSKYARRVIEALITVKGGTP